MTELDCKIDGCDYSGSPQGLRSHLHGRKDDEHVNAAANRSHHDWYPVAYGLDEEGTDDEGGDEGGDTPTEGADPVPSEEGSDGEGVDTLDPDPSDGGTESPDEEDEYAAQWEGADTPAETPSEGADPDPSEEGSDGEDDYTPSSEPSDGGGMDLGTAVVLGTGALAVAVLVGARGSDPSEGGTESPDATNPDDTLDKGGRGGTGWGQDGGSDPLEGTETDDMDFTPTET